LALKKKFNWGENCKVKEEVLEKLRASQILWASNVNTEGVSQLSKKNEGGRRMMWEEGHLACHSRSSIWDGVQTQKKPSREKGLKKEVPEGGDKTRRNPAYAG